MNNYEQIIKNRITGWNTWDVRNMLSHVLMPYGFAINIGVKEYQEGDFLSEALLGRAEGGKQVQRVVSGVEKVYPEAHSLDGSYIMIKVEWRGIEFFVETSTNEGDIFIKIIPLKNQKKSAVVVVSGGILWNKPGSITKTDYGFCMQNYDVACKVKTTGRIKNERSIPVSTPYIAVSMEEETYFYTGKDRKASEIKDIINWQREKYENQKNTKTELKKYFKALEETMAWNVIYDPINDSFKTIVGRTWSSEWGGYVQHCWDMFFNALSYSIFDKDYAYNSIIEIMREITKEGFIPNCAAATGFVTLDRSQPPVGSLITALVYEKYKDKWLIEMVFDKLFEWNSWYYNSRQVKEGILGWGSTPFSPNLNNYWESAGVGEFYGAAMESGLDNSPMYDNIEIDKITNTMKLGDAGLTSLFIVDAKSLIKLANVLNKKEELRILEKRIEVCKNGLEKLWCEEKGIYLNLHTDTDKFDYQLSPTHFYSLLTGCVPKERIDRMIDEHLLNEKEFWGEWVIPSISKDNPSFPEQDYWRGRIWPPMNLLVYLGLKKTGKDEIAKEFAKKSGDLIMKEWLTNRHVHENYCAITGEGCNRENSEKFYTWGTLLAYIYIDAFENID